MREIILHTFQWNLKHIENNLEDIKQQGFTAVQISPVNKCKEGSEWWCYYQPLAFTIGNRSGSKEDLIELCTKANEIGIKVICDVVLRHCATDDGQLIPSDTVDLKLRSNPDFWANTENITDYDVRYQVTHNSCGMPMLNYDNHDLQDIYIKFLQELKDCGVSGFRVDQGKHLSLPSEGSDFWPRVFGGFSDMFNYAECLESKTSLLDKYTKFINVLTDGYSTDKSKMVVYIMTHDTEYTFQSTLHITDDMIKSEWDYLLKYYNESHVLFFCRRYSQLWKSDEIRNSNIFSN